MQFLTFSMIMLVTVAIVVGGVSLYIVQHDYRRWAYLGAAIAFMVMGMGSVMLQLGQESLGAGVLTIGIIFNVVLTGVYIMVRSLDKVFQSHGFYLKSWQKKQGDHECMNQSISSTPHTPYRN